MSVLSKALPVLTVLMLGSATVAASADDPCAGFKWSVTQERALFAKAPDSAVAGKDATSAPAMTAERLYEFSLAPQDGVKFVLPPGKKSLTDGAYAGLVHLRVPAAGLYRVSLDEAFWIDVVNNHELIASTDFTGAHGCNAPHKIVQFNLPASGELVLQLSGSLKDRVRVTLTRAPAAAH